MCIPQVVCADSQFIYKLDKKPENHHFYGFSCINFKLLKIRAIFSHEGKVSECLLYEKCENAEYCLSF